MRRLPVWLLLSFFLIPLTFSQYWDDNGNNDFDLDWLWMGSNLRSLGRPKLKISEHPDGYSAELGIMEHYMRFRWSCTHHSLDFNVLDHKGSVKMKNLFNRRSTLCWYDEYDTKKPRSCEDDKEIPYFPDISGIGFRVNECSNINCVGNTESCTPTCPGCGTKSEFCGQLGADDFTVEADISGSSEYSPLDGKMKLKVWMPKNMDLFEMDLSIVNSARLRDYMYFPSTTIRDIDNMEILLKVVINADNLTDSTADFDFNLKAREMYRQDPDSSGGDWLPGNYNLTGSLKVREVDIGRNLEAGQNRIKAELEMAEITRFDGTTILEPSFDAEETFRGSADSFRRTLTVDGMINLTGEGSRLAIIKVEDAESNRPLGRIQARLKDEENFRVEVFGDGNQIGAINWELTQKTSNITVEDSAPCESDFEDDYLPDLPDYSFGVYSNITDDYPSNGNETDVVQNSTSLGIKNCNINRLLEEIDNGEVWGSKIYKDVFYIGDPPSWRKRMKDRNKVYEDYVVMKDGHYGYNMTISNGYDGYDMSCSIKNSTNKTNLQTSVKEMYRDYDGDMQEISYNVMDMEIKPIENEELNMKLTHNNERILDGWFYLTKDILRITTEKFPSWIKADVEMIRARVEENRAWFRKFGNSAK